MTDPAHFPADYAAARRRFLAAAEARGARIDTRPIPARGPRGEELALDVAYIGPAFPERLLVVSSGIHGVEGFAGSAIQHQLLRARRTGSPCRPTPPCCSCTR